MRRGFTLVELLVIIGIMGLMVTVGIVSVRSGQGAARVKGATRDVFAAIRHARSTALVTGQPAIVTYATEEIDGEVSAKIEVTSAKLFDSTFDRSSAQTLTGGPLEDGKRELVHIEREGGDAIKDTAAKGVKVSKAAKKNGAKAPTTAKGTKFAADEPVAEESGEGQTIEEILFAPVDASVVKGIRIKAAMAEDVVAEQQPRRANKISVFSNVDYLLGRYKDAKADAKKKEQETAAKDAASAAPSAKTAPADESQEPLSVVWETNGRVEAHQVWVYPDGKKPEDGLCIKIDRFGAAKVVRGDGKEDD